MHEPQFILFCRRKSQHGYESLKESVTWGRLRTTGLLSPYGQAPSIREVKGLAPNARPMDLPANLESRALIHGSDPSWVPSALHYDGNNSSGVSPSGPASSVSFLPNSPPSGNPVPQKSEGRRYKGGNRLTQSRSLFPLLYFWKNISALRVVYPSLQKWHGEPSPKTWHNSATGRSGWRWRKILRLTVHRRRVTPVAKEVDCVPLHHMGSKTASKRLYNGNTVVFVLRIHQTEPCVWNPKWPFQSGPSPP